VINSRCLPMPRVAVSSRWLSLPMVALAVVLVSTAPWRAWAADEIDPADGRISWRVDQQSGLASQYVRHANRSSVCEIAMWDTSTFFAKVTFCETLGGWYWKPAYMNLDLMMEDFSQLTDFITAGPEPFGDAVTRIGEVDLYGFDVDQAADVAAWQCVGFIKGFNRENRGYQQMLIAYFCDDTGRGMVDARIGEALAGLRIEQVFDQLAD
jgi:hypothetical protein